MSFLFGSRRGPDPVEQIDPSEDARELRLRIARRGGHQSTLLFGKGGGGTPKSIFKRNLGGTKSKRRT